MKRECQYYLYGEYGMEISHKCLSPVTKGHFCAHFENFAECKHSDIKRSSKKAGISKLREILYHKVKAHMGWGDEKTVHWFNTDNPILGGMCPDMMLMLGRGEKLSKIINGLIEDTRL